MFSKVAQSRILDSALGSGLVSKSNTKLGSGLVFMERAGLGTFAACDRLRNVGCSSANQQRGVLARVLHGAPRSSIGLPSVYHRSTTRSTTALLSAVEARERFELGFAS